jgi:hypothetical protein
MKEIGRNNFKLHLFITIFLAGVIFSPLSYQNISLSLFEDYQFHLNVVVALDKGEQVNILHLGFHYLTLFFAKFLNIFFPNQTLAKLITVSGFVITLFSFIGSALAILYLIYSSIPTKLINNRKMIPTSLAIGLLVAGPISIFSWSYWYHPILAFWQGYFIPNSFHNPTYNLLRPLSLLLFFFAIRFIFPSKRDNYPPFVVIIGLALLTLIGGYSKPNFILGFLPALLIFSFIRIFRHEQVNFPILFGGILVPSLLVFFPQYFVNFTDGNEMLFKPFGIINYWAVQNSLIWLSIKIILSLAFPILVSLLYYKEAGKDKFLLMGWITTIISIVISLLFIETSRPKDWNFSWGAHVSVFVLFVMSLIFLMRVTGVKWVDSYDLKRDYRFQVSINVLAIHIITNIPWLIINFYYLAVKFYGYELPYKFELLY